MSSLHATAPLLIFLPNGVQGGAVVRSALHRGHKVRVLVRNPARCSVPQNPGLEVVKGDLADLASLKAACSGVRHIVLQIPIGSPDTMQSQAQNALSAALANGVEGMILKLASASRRQPCDEPSFLANQMIEDMAGAVGIPFAVVRPTMYLDNLLKPSACLDIMTKGVFAPPIAETQAIAWTSTQDCADAALTLIENGAFHGDHRIAGPQSLTGDVLTARVAAALGRPVAYHAQAIADFEWDVDQVMGEGMGRRIASKFRYFEANRMDADRILATPFSPGHGLEGFQPTTVEDWARRNRSAFFSASSLA